MPYRVFKESKQQVWRLEKVYENDKRKNYIINKKYKSKQTAINAAKNFIKFRRGKPVVKGNRIMRE